MNSSSADKVGMTPLVELDLSTNDNGSVFANILAKLEFHNPSGSSKDRLAKRFLSGLKNDTRTLIVPSNGNLSIAVAVLADKKRYKVIVIVPEQMSNDRVSLLKALGVEIVRFNEAQNATSIATNLAETQMNAEILDEHQINDTAVYADLAEEIIKQVGEQGLDYVFVGVESGVTITSLASQLKKKFSNIRVIGVEPKNSCFSSADSSQPPAVVIRDWKIEDIGSSVVSPVFQKEVVDSWCKVSDKEAFSTARRLIREHGIICGPSSGAVLAAAMSEAKNGHLNNSSEKPRCVVIFNDTARNYTSTLLNDEWLIENDLFDDSITHHLENRYSAASVEDLQLPAAKAIEQTTTVLAALNLMLDYQYSQLPVLNDKKKLVGCVSLEDLDARLNKGIAQQQDAVKDHMISFRRSISHKKYQVITPETSLANLAKFFEENSFAVVTDADRKWCLAVATKYDLMKFLHRR